MKQELKDITMQLRRYAVDKKKLQEMQTVSSPSIGENISGTGLNGSETKMIRIADLAFKVHQIDDALQQLDPGYTFILQHYIINREHSAVEMAKILGLSKRGFQDRKTRALLAFKTAVRRNEKQLAV